MSMSDPISDYLTRIRNAHMASKDWVDIPSSLLKRRISFVLREEKFIRDYVKIAEGIGLRTWYAINEEEIIKALKEARIESKSCMIVVPTEKYRYAPDSGVWWEVIGAEVTNDAKTKELVKLKESGRKKQRYYI